MNKENKKPYLIWFTGLSGSGKSTLAIRLQKELLDLGYKSCILDGDVIRRGVNSDLTFSEEDRSENIRRVAEIAALFLEIGIVVLAAFISPYAEDRQKIKKRVGEDNYIEIFVNTPIEICESRDVKGLYRRARLGEINNFTGITAPYEQPLSPDIKIDTQEFTIEKCIEKILNCPKLEIK